MLPNVTYDLQFTSIKVLKFDALYCTYGRWECHTVAALALLTQYLTEEVHASSNRIVSVEQHVITYMPQTIVNITIADNRFTFGWYMLEINNAKHIKHVNVSHQYKSYEQYLAFFEDECNDTRHLPKQHTAKSNDIVYRQAQRKSKIAQNLTSCLNECYGTTPCNVTSNKWLTVYLCFPKSIEYLNIAHSRMQTPHIMDYVILDYRNIKRLIANDNVWDQLNGKVFSNNLTEADVSKQFIRLHRPKFLQGCQFESFGIYLTIILENRWQIQN